MSREGDQAITMLTIIIGAMKTLKIENKFAKVELKEAISTTDTAARLAIDNWPTWKNWKWIRARFRMFIISIPDTRHEYSAIEMVRIAERLAIDLTDIYKEGGTRGDLVAPVLPGLQKLVNHMDKDGSNFIALEDAGKSMDKLYDILEFDYAQFN